MIREVLIDILTGEPPMELRMLMSDEEYILPYGGYNPYVEQAIEIAERNPGIPLSIVEKLADKILADYEKEVVNYGGFLLKQ